MSLSLKEIQKQELNILRETIKFLKENSINYYAAYGTYLGAVRHKNFIPWDDDIDIFIPRNDYDILLEKLRSNNSLITKDLEGECFELGNSDWPFLKIVNKKITLKSKSKCDKYLWIDIFPLDGIPENCFFYNIILMFLRNLFIVKRASIVKTNNSKGIKRFLKGIGMIVIKPIPYNTIISFYIKHCKKYKFKNVNKVADCVWGDIKRNYIYKDEMINKDYLFDNILINGFYDYDKILKRFYGDYKIFPPKSERNTHNFEATILKQKEKER